MRALVTGANGFVGRYLCDFLRARGSDVVTAAHRDPVGRPDFDLDLGDAASVATVVREARADVVYHLAAQAFVPQATADPLGTYDTNVLGTARLVDAVRALPRERRPRVILASAGEVYGERVESELPLREALAPTPATPYAASKVAAEAIVLASARTYGFDAIVTRAFNHIGPGQSDRFVVASFAKRLAAIAGGANPLFPVGNLTPARDFLDVRDVVRAYVALAERGVAGQTYNVCSGVPTQIQEILRQLVMTAGVGVEIREDPSLVRPVDVPRLFGDNAKLRETTGWAPSYSLARSLHDVYDAAREALASA
ncbi:MAG: GDP-mannose 4,6-dehydratase [Vulcanimicrobiaceae bacterium]